jgi:ligand-binding SRPBCC domain-containing protein
MTVQLEHEEMIDAPLEVVFDLSLDVDAHQASMARSKERAIGGVTGGRIGLGEEVTWRAWHFGIPFTMTSRITELDRPRRFVDEQARGPFLSFRHEHLFARRDNRTAMTDRVQFKAPVGGDRLRRRTCPARVVPAPAHRGPRRVLDGRLGCAARLTPWPDTGVPVRSRRWPRLRRPRSRWTGAR